MYVLGIHDSHCATATLLKDGKIIAAASEERFTRVKNHAGFPFAATEYCLDLAKIKGRDVDLLVFAGTTLPPFLATAISAEPTKQILPVSFLKMGRTIYFKLRSLLLFLEYKIPHFPNLEAPMTNFIFGFFNRQLEKDVNRLICQKTGINPQKFVKIDHHLAHTYAALYSSSFPSPKNNILVFTCDGGGDGLSATLSLYYYKNKNLRRVVKNSVYHSLGTFYSYITMFLGMQVLEHEYKVMGLAPYAPEVGKKQAYEILKPLISLDKKTLTFKTKINSELFGLFMQEHLQKVRFDYVAGAGQQITEEILSSWVREAVRKYKINTIACGGGVFMNVKANQKILELPEVRQAFFMPSGGDESNAIGAAYWGYKKLTGKKPALLDNLYLGPKYKKREIEAALRKRKTRKKYRVEIYPKIEKKIASLLAQGKVVARLAGRMEWGARALGNRSILADAGIEGVKETINKMIKIRDFWMPFAPVILKEDEDKYLVNPKKIDAPYMIITFDSTKKAQEDLRAAIHPYDKTLRPQVIDQKTNPSYYQILKEFKKLTGKGGFLNTSFNIHGEPIVCAPEDALSTFERSGLKYLSLENYLISKE